MEQNWIIDVAAKTATHNTGLVVKFYLSKDSSYWDGSPISPIKAWADANPDLATQEASAKLMREAGDAFMEALKHANG